ncbi:hypothetical protein SASPL_114323 [Salvia splendens]|uniref:DUF8040 domain-containing protein n=1 Tax=Salvia splendens TaxID=180675 RepID=A0A8X8Y0G4_SALSN|nr:hypothetical protein SASPL_114323 [Salvia splendens]
MDNGEDSRENDMTTLLILLEEVIRNYQLNLLLISFMISLLCPQNRKRKRWDRLGQSAVLDSIPAHVRQLDRLVRITDRACVDNLRMDRNTFGRLCRILRDRVGLIDQRLVSVEEQVAMFLCVLAHHKKSRIPTPIDEACSDRRWKWFKVVIISAASNHQQRRIQKWMILQVQCGPREIIDNFLVVLNMAAKPARIVSI